ncbi:MAG: DUF2442 domain-containing protein [Hyphomicrobiaceae bacterium]
MLCKVIEIKAIAPFSIRVRFNDGRAGVHDCSADIAGEGPIVKALQEPAYFARVFLEAGSPTWPNGFDMCPDWLRMQMEAARELQASAAE